MELRHLRYFVTIAEEGSFRRAAERLWIAQPGLSTQIRKLEDELDVKLFERHPHGVTLTGAGTLFLERARATLSAADIAGATGHDLELGLAGKVNLGVACGARWQLTSAVLEEFARERSRVEFGVLEGLGGTLWRDLRDGRLDAVIAPSCFASGDLRRLTLGNEPWVVLMGTSHRLAGIGRLAAIDLDGEHVAVAAHRDGAGYDRVIADLLDELGVSATFVPVGPGPAIYRAVAKGEVLALTTAPEALPPGVLARPLDARSTLGWDLLWRDEPATPALAEFVRVAARYAVRPSAVSRALIPVAA